MASANPVTCFVHSVYVNDIEIDQTVKFHSTTFQADNILKKKLGDVFKGTYGRDQLAALKTQAPACYVINMDPIGGEEGRWRGRGGRRGGDEGVRRGGREGRS